jgi:TolB protein
MQSIWRVWVGVLLLWAGVPSIGLAQFKVEISGVGLVQLPVAVAPFKGEEGWSQRVGGIVAADLTRSGQIKPVDWVGAVVDEAAPAEASRWRQWGAEYVVVGSVSRLADGRLDVRMRLWDVLRAQHLLSESWVTTPAQLRWVAHRAADVIYEKLTGSKGVFSTRITYVTRSAGRYHLWVADADGENAQAALSDTEPIISPAWSPQGTHLAYVSFALKKPVVYVQELATGRRVTLANFRGSNSAPAWSADGSQLAVTLTREGLPQIYLIARAGGEPRRLGHSGGIDTEPQFSADGKWLYFVSDRGGAPQIYRMPAAGGSAERVTFSGSYNISPALSPDGRWLAYISRMAGGGYKLHVMDLSSGAAQAITDTQSDESPSFSPNSRLIMYATRLQGQEVLMTSTLDGQIKTRLNTAGGVIREPDWGPFVATGK